MRYSQRRYSPLQFLSKERKVLLLHVDEGDKEEMLLMGESFIVRMRKLLHSIDSNNIINPSETFQEAAAIASKDKLFDHIRDSIDLLDGASGVLLRKETTIFYFIREFEKGNVIISFVAIANTTNTIVGFSLPSDDGSGKQQMWFSNLFLKPPSWESKDKRDVVELQYLFVHYMITSVLIFKRYAPVETKEFGAGEKTKYLGQKCINDTNYKITYLDSKWFTNIVKSAGFGVRGHFRLQPFGTGRNERRLIYIEPFEKTGYTAPARKLKSENL